MIHLFVSLLSVVTGCFRQKVFLGNEVPPYVGELLKGMVKEEKLVHQQGLTEFSGNGGRVGRQSLVSCLLQGWG